MLNTEGSRRTSHKPLPACQIVAVSDHSVSGWYSTEASTYDFNLRNEKSRFSCSYLKMRFSFGLLFGNKVLFWRVGRFPAAVLVESLRSSARDCHLVVDMLGLLKVSRISGGDLCQQYLLTIRRLDAVVAV